MAIDSVLHFIVGELRFRAHKQPCISQLHHLVCRLLQRFHVAPFIEDIPSRICIFSRNPEYMIIDR